MFDHWRQRHQNPTSLTLHRIGIPLTVLAIPALIFAVHTGRTIGYLLAAALVVVGYALQFIGHAREGNDPGEIILIKKLLGKPYIAVAEKEKDR